MHLELFVNVMIALVVEADRLCVTGDGHLHARHCESFKVQQAGAGQSATRPESESEGSEKPQPKAEGHSR